MDQRAQPEPPDEPVINRRGDLRTPGYLLVTILSVASSYSENVEYDVEPGEVTDTLQWWIGEAESFRIRTYAMEHSIHVHGLEHAAPGADAIIAVARENNRKSYEDIRIDEALIRIDDPTDDDAIVAALIEAGLPASVEIADRFLFWLPDVDQPYRTKTPPVDEADRRPEVP